MKLGSQKVGKVTDPELWKHFWTGREGPKRSKNDPEMSVLGGFERKSNLFLCTIFNSVWKWEQCYIYLPKLLVCKKSSFWVMVQSRPIRIQDSLNCNMSETSWGMKLTFCSWISTHRNNRYSRTFQIGVLRKGWACQKRWQILSGFISSISWVIWC